MTQNNGRSKIKFLPGDVIIHKDDAVELPSDELVDAEEFTGIAPVLQININFTCESDAKDLIEVLGVTADVGRLTMEVEKRLDESRKAWAEKQKMEQARTGRGDTGEPVFGQHGAPNVSIVAFVKSLKNFGLKATACQYITRPKRDRRTGGFIPNKSTHVVRITFESDEDSKEVIGLAEKLVSFLENLGGAKFCHVWQNDFSDTINLAGGFTQIPARELVFTDGAYKDPYLPGRSPWASIR